MHTITRPIEQKRRIQPPFLPPWSVFPDYPVRFSLTVQRRRCRRDDRRSAHGVAVMDGRSFSPASVAAAVLERRVTPPTGAENGLLSKMAPARRPHLLGAWTPVSRAWLGRELSLAVALPLLWLDE
ncbi:hypothetical protein MTO96_002099 [Rhipicephalus appendiculatus]